MQVVRTAIQAFYQPRDLRLYQPVTLNALPLAVALVVIGFLAYMSGSPLNEEKLRSMFLILLAGGALIALFHYWNPTLGRWMGMVVSIALVFGLSFFWQEPDLLFLLVLPAALGVVMIGMPAMLLAAIVETALVLGGNRVLGDGFRLPDESLILLSTLWLTVLVLGVGYGLMERLLRQATSDHTQMEALLEESRDQQFKLAQALDDLAHANRQLSLLYEKNIALRRMAEEATEAKTTYIARVSHEIRTPLNMILGIAEVIIENQDLYEEGLPADLMEDIHIIRRNCDHLLSLVNDVLDLTRAEAGHLVLKKDWVEIAVEVEKALEIVQPLARKKQLALTFDPPESLPIILGDRTRIRQVILNLLSNAVRYTEQGIVSVHVNADDKWITVEVRDTGPGIQPEDAERIFEPFYRGIASARQEILGTGLGLSVSRQLVELHGGKIWLQTRVDSGSSFFFQLPVTELSSPPQSPARLLNEQWMWVERKRRPAIEVSANRKRVVVCEEENYLTGHLERRQEGVELSQVNTVEDLVREVKNIPAHLALFNAVSQEELQSKLDKAAAQIPDTPLVGCLFTPLSVQLAKAGVKAYFQKPFDINRLRETVEHLTPSRRKILLVDDSVEVQQLVARVLSVLDGSSEFLLAASGDEAQQVLKRQRPDIILLDLALPGMDGWQFLEWLRSEYPREALLKGVAPDPVPVLILSAYDFTDAPPSSKEVVITRHGGIGLDELLHITLNLAGWSAASD